MTTGYLYKPVPTFSDIFLQCSTFSYMFQAFPYLVHTCFYLFLQFPIPCSYKFLHLQFVYSLFIPFCIPCCIPVLTFSYPALPFPTLFPHPSGDGSVFSFYSLLPSRPPPPSSLLLAPAFLTRVLIHVPCACVFLTVSPHTAASLGVGQPLGPFHAQGALE